MCKLQLYNYIQLYIRTTSIMSVHRLEQSGIYVISEFQCISYVDHVQLRSNQRVQPLSFAASRLQAVYGKSLGNVFHFDLQEGMYASKKSCATQQLDAVGFAKFEK